MLLYNCDFCEQGFTYRILTVWPKAVLKCRADLNFSVTVKDPQFLFLPVRFMIRFSGSLCFFFWLSESAGFKQLRGVFIMCISSVEANKCRNNQKTFKQLKKY